MEGVFWPTTNRMPELNESLCKYLAGLVDSDGTISFDFRNENRNEGRANLGLKVGIASSDAVDKLHFIEGLPQKIGHGCAFRHGNERRYVYWVLNSRRDLEMVAPRLVKHMCVKAKHLQRMLDKWREKRGTMLSPDECAALRAWSKESRLDAGPLKPKNHLTWAWVSGYLDGNGHYMFSLANKGAAKETRSMRISATCHRGDAEVLELFKKCFGGRIRVHNLTENAMTWDRNLGLKDRSFALHFLRKVHRFSQFKRHRIEQILAFHHQQRLTDQTSTEEETV